jgi:hypothetical protein
MKGATADPWVSMISAPKVKLTAKIGSSQYFFRTRRNLQNSFANDNIGGLRTDPSLTWARVPALGAQSNNSFLHSGGFRNESLPNARMSNPTGVTTA